MHDERSIQRHECDISARKALIGVSAVTFSVIFSMICTNILEHDKYSTCSVPDKYS